MESATKKCSHCKVDQVIENFSKRKVSSDGLNFLCRECQRVVNRETYQKHSSKRILASKKWYEENKDAHRAKCKERRNSDLPKARAAANKYKKSRSIIDPSFKLQNALRCRIQIVVRTTGIKKAAKTMELIGCSIEECRQHLESLFTEGMTWNNHGEWHIDHKRPVASYDLTDPQQQKQCFHYTNLQPLWKVDNLKKSSKYAS